MGIILAGVANLLMARKGQQGSYVLAQTVGDQKFYFRTEELKPHNFIGMRPTLAFSMVQDVKEATRFRWRLAAWKHQRHLPRSGENVSAVSIERYRPS